MKGPEKKNPTPVSSEPPKPVEPVRVDGPNGVVTLPPSLAEIVGPKGEPMRILTSQEYREILDDLKQELKERAERDEMSKLNADETVLFIEYMSRGRLEDYMGKMAAWKKPFPNEILWQVFDCCKCWFIGEVREDTEADTFAVFRGVIGMAYPNGFQPVGSDPATDIIPQVSETCEGLKSILGMQETSEYPFTLSQLSDKTLTLFEVVHFDICPLNGEYFKSNLFRGVLTMLQFLLVTLIQASTTSCQSSRYA